MDFLRLHDSFHSDVALLRAAVAATDPRAAVPGCPEWTITDLARHVSGVYLSVAECIRLGRFLEQRPPDRPETDPVTDLDHAVEALEQQFATHPPASPVPTWYEPDQTVGFWMRRMAQETVIHRVDAELAAGGAPAPIPEDIAVDGVDEMFTLFLAYRTSRHRSQLEKVPELVDERPILVRTTTGRAWRVTADSKKVTVVDSIPTADAALTVTGTPDVLLLWLWNRAADDTVTIEGDPALRSQFETFRKAVT